MISLRLLGLPALLGDDGPLTGRAGQRHRLALLALLATSPGRSSSRDKLMALLWPEAEARRARHLLNVSVHVLRKALGADVLLSEGDDLRLDAERFPVDAIAFEEELGAGDPRRAVELYLGPFLDGFHLEGSPEFEKWLDGERDRLARLYQQALETLASEAEAGDEWSEAVDWRRRLAASDPYNTRWVLKLMRALEAAGDRGNALQLAEAHVTLLREDLSAEPDLALVALARRLREQPEEVANLRDDIHAPPRGGEKPAPRVGTLQPAEKTQPGRGPTTRPLLGAERDGAARRLSLLAPLGLVSVLALGGILAMLFAAPGSTVPDDGPAFEPTAIAVLPFQNHGPEGPHAYLAPGLHDELLNRLAQLGNLSVRGRASVMGYAGTRKPVQEIARELQVGTLVEGSVQVIGDRLRVTVQLVDGATDEHLWAERYEGTIEDAFALQSEITRRIAEAVGGALSDAEREGLARAPTSSPEAYRLYLQGRAYHTRPGWERHKWDAARQLYEEAVALDPQFALARAALSEIHGTMYWLRYDPSPARAAQQRAEAETALRLAPGLPQTHRAMGLVHYWGRRDFRRAVEEFRVALDGMPGDAWTQALIGYTNRRLGNWDGALAAFEAAARLDPRDAGLFADLGGNTLRFLHRYPEALRAYDRALTLAPDVHIAAVRRAWTYMAWTGTLDSLRAALRRLPPDARLAPGGTPTAQHLQLLLWDRQADSLLHLLAASRTDLFHGQDFYLPAPLYAAWAHRLRGEEGAAAEAFASALVVLDSAVGRLPDDWRVHAARGLALAGSGRRDEALQEARWLERSVAYQEDAYDGPDLAENRARILAQAGEAEAALAELEQLLPGPGWLSTHEVRLDPLWDPIRGHPRFRRLVARHTS